MTAHLSPEVVAFIRSSPETGAALARQFGIARQTVTKIRTGKTHTDTSRPSRESTVRLILGQPPNLSLAEISELTGIDRRAAEA